MSQERLAEVAGVHRNTIANLETNRAEGISLRTVEALAKALGVTRDHLLDEEPHRSAAVGADR